MTTPVSGSATTLVQVRELLTLTREVVVTHARPDLELHLQRAAERLERPEAVVCVAGEFKQGKSALVNALLGREICPVSDELTTSLVTLISHGPELRATARLTAVDGTAATEEEIAPDRLFDLVTQPENHDRDRRVELLSIAAPLSLLERGLSLVDTPGVAAVSPGRAAATLAFLPSADALLFVTDASAEISTTEVDFLVQARERCPVVIAALTKVDMYPDWRRIQVLSQQRLANAGIPMELVPVSSELRSRAFERADAGMNLESGIPALLQVIGAEVLAKRESIAMRSALDEAHGVLLQLRIGYEAKRASGASGDTRLEETRARINQLRTRGARWAQVLTDGFTDLVSTTEHEFTASLRALQRETEERILALDPGGHWPEIGTNLQTGVASIVSDAFNRLSTGSEAVSERIATVLGDEARLDLDGGDSRDVDAQSLWAGRELTTRSLVGQIASSVGALRGAYGGIFMLGMLANFAGVVLIAPLLVGAGAVFGGRQLLEERRRSLEARRQEATRFAREFVEEVRFEVQRGLRDYARELQRAVRDHFTQRLQELEQTYRNAADSLARERESAASQQGQSREAVEDAVGALNDMLSVLDAHRKLL